MTMPDVVGLALESGSDINDENDTDSDSVPKSELQKAFSAKCEVMCSTNIGKNKFILHIDGTLKSNPDFALGLTNHSVEVHNINEKNSAKTQTIHVQGNLTGVKFNVENDKILYIGTNKELITTYDLRTGGKAVSKFTDSSEKAPERVGLCFDVSQNQKLLSAGTELYDGDAFLLFWDVRSPKLLGGYWESHTDDITNVKFHPNDMNKLISASTDGLINLYNLEETSEDDALVDCFNTESSVDKINWHMKNKDDFISCITHTSDVEVYKMDEAVPVTKLSREDVCKKILRTNSEFTYPIGVHSMKNGKMFLLSASSFNKGDCARCVLLDKKQKYPGLVDLPFTENQIVKTSWMNSNTNVLATGSENGYLNLYKICDDM